MKIIKQELHKENIYNFYKFCKDLKLNIIGTMCIPPKRVFQKIILWKWIE